MSHSQSSALDRGAPTVLFIDGDPDTLDALAFLAGELPVHVCTANTAKDALAMLRIIQVDVIVVEPRGTGISWRDLLEGLFADPYAKGATKIVLTSDAREETRQCLLDMGCRHVLLKPCRAEVLLHVIATSSPSRLAFANEHDGHDG